MATVTIAELDSRPDACTASSLVRVEEGKGLHGGQAELVRVPQADGTLMRLPEGVSLTEGLLFKEIFSPGFFCAHQAGIQRDGIYIVVGCGPVGLMAILGAREAGARIYLLWMIYPSVCRWQNSLVQCP